MNNFAQQIMEDIKEGKIKPLARWKIVTRNLLLLSLAILLVLLGMLATSFIFYTFDYADWDIYRRLPWRDFWWAFLGSLPYLWLAVFIIFAFLAARQFRQQGTAYRYSLAWILGPIIALSVIGGAIAYYSGFQTVMREHMSPRFRFSRVLFPQAQAIWQSPDQGRLAGVVVSKEGNFIILRDERERVWQVRYIGSQDISRLIQNMRIKMLGQKSGESQFTATEIREFFQGMHEPRVIMFKEVIPAMPAGENRTLEFLPPPLFP